MLAGALAAVIAAYLYDRWVAAPGSEQAHASVQKLMDQHLARPGGPAQSLHSADVQRSIGFAPTFTQVEPNYTIEWYCWWGWMPGLNTYKRYITVVYIGREPRRLSAHFLNEAPPEESLPKYYLPSEVAEPLPVPGPLGLPGPGGPPEDAKSKPGEQGDSGLKNKSGETGKLNEPTEEPIKAAP